ncbi:type I-F CRISPR-associated endoribonuclease Cas6/Csy4 [Paracoccus sp. ME4]|uniref:type I-F CRISPR-associated endoribonuclease Cas6/Csy4 n=1 Tax=Paracoccus sp. ME4 TaxID=3138066 RepID=UPI00398ABCF5
MDQVTKELAGGLGVCTPSHRLIINASSATTELGAFPDLHREVFAALHRVNRHSGASGYVAICMPDAAEGRGIEAMGNRFVLFGTEELLQAVLDDRNLAALSRRGMFRGRIREQDTDPAGSGMVLMRTQARVKHIPDSGLAARRARRDARRAAHIAETKGRFGPSDKPAKPPRITGYVMLRPGLRIDLISESRPWTGETILVNSYGLSTMTAPAVLPWIEGAA